MSKRKDGAIIGRPKGGKNRKYSPIEKKQHLDAYYKSNLPHAVYARNNGIPDGTFRKWIANYEKFK